MCACWVACSGLAALMDVCLPLGVYASDKIAAGLSTEVLVS